MIITRRNGSLFLVEQNEHARLAADLCERWGNERFATPSPREPTLLATAMHDEGWRAADDAVRFNSEAGRPLHFLEIDIADHIDLYRRGVELAAGRDAYAGLLVSMHWTGLYRSRWGLQETTVFVKEDEPLARLLNEVVTAEEQRWIELKRSLVAGTRRSDFEAELWHNYELLQAHDVMSLYVCTGVVRPPAEGDETVPVISTLKAIDQTPGTRTIEAVPTRTGAERVELRLTPVEPGVVVVDPYPFDEDGISVRATARVIPDRRYASPEEARDAVAAAESVQIGAAFRRA
jgi:Protein of unknown function (DUF3891)